MHLRCQAEQQFSNEIYRNIKAQLLSLQRFIKEFTYPIENLQSNFFLSVSYNIHKLYPN